MKYIIYPILLVFLLLSTITYAQSTIVRGIVTDAATQKALSYVTVSFTGTTIGSYTDDHGIYSLKTTKEVKQLSVSVVGYKTSSFQVTAGVEQIINVKLVSQAKQLTEVVIKSAKKEKYHNKDNPAVELIRQVIANKAKNRADNYKYVEYKEYDKTQMSFINVSDQLSQKKFFRKYKFFLDNKDSTLLPGKTLLPVFLDEKLSQTYYRKNPEKTKTIVIGQKSVNFGAFMDNEGFGIYIKRLYGDIDIYKSNIFLVTNEFLSPIADSAPTFYKFFITDTVNVGNTKVVRLSFTPRNTTDMLFEGDIYITLDGNYAVQKADLTINKNINLNWVRHMNVVQDFEPNPDGRWHVSKTDTRADFGTSKNGKHGIFGEHTVTYKNYVVDQLRPDTIYDGEATVSLPNVKSHDDTFWDQNRLDTLTKAELHVYTNLDSLKRMPSYRRTVDIATLLLAGYKSFGPVEIGPANAFYSFNPVEGFRLRFGGRTTPQLSKRYYFETYAAYGFKDEKWKYFLSGTYSFNDQSIYRFPQHYIRASFQRDTKIPGQDLQFVQQDNFLLSFKRGVNDKYLYNDYYRLDYVHEFENHLSYNLGFRKWIQAPAGSLYFLNTINNIPNIIDKLTTTETTAQIRYAPHEQFYQGKLYRRPIFNKYPKFTLDITAGLKGALGGQYNYQRLRFTFEKRAFFSYLGYGDIAVEGGNIFGKVPYPLLTIHQANQTYAYDIYSYNLMNFLEFVSDHYVSFKIDQHFNGFFFNKIPLFNKLKWREVLSYKMLYGGVRAENDPTIHPDLYQFPVEKTGSPITYALGQKPYMEGAVGIENIFKFIQVDLVRRFSYLDHPNVAPWGIRTKVKFDF